MSGLPFREVQQLSESVRNSPEIHLALQAYTSLHERNYVRFFRLVRETTFLNACILHRYFNQIRADALKVLMKAYSASKGNAKVS